jgi:hypothetical protein
MNNGNTPEPPSAFVTIEGKCDVCSLRDGKHSLNLQKCKKCGVCVHETCYGRISTSTKDSNFVCLACQSIGKSITGVRWNSNVEVPIVQRDRPSECALCSVDDGFHAMHPVYRESGPKGRQLILPPGDGKDERLAWAHSLCAQGICSSRSAQGCVYACDKYGRYEGDDGLQGNPDASDDDGNTALVTHHYVICGTDGKTDDWTKAIGQLRTSVKCIVCGRNDKSSTRIPIQCSAGDDQEYIEFKNSHSLDEACSQSLHVGCAAWRIEGAYQQMFFYPGTSEGRDETQFQEPVSEIFCPLHASDIKKVVSNVPLGTKRKYQEGTNAILPSPLSNKRMAAIKETLMAKQISVLNSEPLKSNSATIKNPSLADISRRGSGTARSATARNVLLSQAQKKSPATPKAIISLGASSKAKKMPPAPPDLEPIERHSGGRVAHKSSLQRQSSTAPLNEPLAPPDLGPLRRHSLGQIPKKSTMPHQSIPSQLRQLRPDDCVELPNPTLGVPKAQVLSRISSAPLPFSLPKIQVLSRDLSGSLSSKPAPIPSTPRESIAPISIPRKRPRFGGPLIKKRNISESKSGEKDGSQDWFSEMVNDVGKVVKYAKQNKEDAIFLVSERRHYWKKKSGLVTSSFREVWKVVVNKFEDDLNNIGAPPNVTPASRLVSVNVDYVEEPGSSTAENKWKHLWHDEAVPFDIGTWDYCVLALKEDNF